MQMIRFCDGPFGVVSLRLIGLVTDLLEGYRISGEQTDLAGMAACCGQLGSDPGALFGVAQGLVLHENAFRRPGLVIAPGQLADWDVSAVQVLGQALRLDPAPLTERRPPERRVAGQCFHSAVLYCALLRNRGLPARARCGFGSYLQPGAWVCHWVTERWDDGRWVCEDTDVGRHDLDAGAFRSAGKAWLACRRDGDDPGSYGIGQGWGWPELRGSLLCDAAALVKDERFTFDRWELAQPPHEPDPAEDAWLDGLAGLTRQDERIPQLREQVKANPPSPGSAHPRRPGSGLQAENAERPFTARLPRRLAGHGHASRTDSAVISSAVTSSATRVCQAWRRRWRRCCTGRGALLAVPPV
jgi:hypothetical protein